jgi:hypothetical protein
MPYRYNDPMPPFEKDAELFITVKETWALGNKNPSRLKARKKFGDSSIQQTAMWRQTRNYCVNCRDADSTDLYSFIIWGDDQYLHDRWVATFHLNYCTKLPQIPHVLS